MRLKLKYLLKKNKGFALILVAIFIPVALLGIKYGTQLIEKSDKDITTFETPYAVALKIANTFNPGRTWDEQKEALYSYGAQAYNDRHYHVHKKMIFTPNKNYILSPKETTFSSYYNYVEFYTYHSRIGNLYYSIQETKNKQNNVPELLAFDPLFSDMMTYQLPLQKSKNIYTVTTSRYTLSETSGQNDRNSFFSSDIYVPEYTEDKAKLEITPNNPIDTTTITCRCPQLKRKAIATLPNCPVDIVVAIPTNRAACSENNSLDDLSLNTSSANSIKSTPIREIAVAFQDFLQNNFLHIRGVSVGVVPYSAKISLSPDKESWTVPYYMSSLDKNETLVKQPYVFQSMFYGSDGTRGGELLDDNPTIPLKDNNNYGLYRNWGQPKIGLPIMARKGASEIVRGISTFTGAYEANNSSQGNNKETLLTSFASPSGDYRFIQMNPNPCYLGYCNVLAMTCEQNCPTFLANPFFITELTPDIARVIHDLELFVPFDDPHNKSNFLFLPVVWAGNLLSMNNWESSSSAQKISSNNATVQNANKKQVVIIIVNAPENFAPTELTYLGFNNDYSEIPMFESDTVQFNNEGFQTVNGTYQGVKGAIECTPSNGESPTPNEGLISKGKGIIKIAFPHKGIIKVVASKGEPASVTFYDDNGVVDNVTIDPNTKEAYPISQTTSSTTDKTPSTATTKSREHKLTGEETFFFRGDKLINKTIDNELRFLENPTTDGPNFGHNLSVKKLKYRAKRCVVSRMILSNQILRFYGTYNRNKLGKDLILNTNGNKGKQKINRMDPCISLDSSRQDTGGTDGLSNTWGYSTWSNGYYINSYNFDPTFYNVIEPKKIVFASDNFPPENIACYEYPENENYLKRTDISDLLGSVESLKDNNDKLLYRAIEIPEVSNVSSSAKISFGNYKYYSQRAYYADFVSKKRRDMTVYKTIQTTRYYKNLCTTPAVNKTTTVTNTKNSSTTSTEYSCDYSANYEQCCYSKTYQENGITYERKYTNTSTNLPAEGSEYEFSPTNKTYTCSGVNWSDLYPKTESKGTDGKTWKYYNTVYYPYKQDTIRYTCSSIGAEGSVQGSGESSYCSSPGSCEPIVQFRTIFSKQYEPEITCNYKKCDAWENTKVYINSPTKEYKFTGCEYDENKDTMYSSGSTKLANFTNKSGGNITGTVVNADQIKEITSQENTSIEQILSPGLYRTAWSDPIDTEVSRQYKFLTYKSSGTLNTTNYQVRDETGTYVRNNPKSISSQSEEDANNPIDIEDENLRIKSNYRYNLYNFFLINNYSFDESDFYTYNESSNTCSKNNYFYKAYKRTTDLDLNNPNNSPNVSASVKVAETDSKLLDNSGIYLVEAAHAEKDPNLNIDETNWVCFSGDGDLSLTFTPHDMPRMNFSHVVNKKYRVLLDNEGVTNTSGTEINTFADGDKNQVFYIVPEQIQNDKDQNGNYYIQLNVSDNVKIISIELNNRPYKIEKSGDIILKKINDSKNINLKTSAVEITDNNQWEFITNLKEAFKIDATAPHFSLSKTDFRQTSGDAYVYCNIPGFSTEIKCTVPSKGNTPTISITGDTKCVVKSQRKLAWVKLNGYIIPEASIYGTVTTTNNGTSTTSYDKNNPIITTWNKSQIESGYTINRSFTGTASGVGFKKNDGCAFQSISFSNISQTRYGAAEISFKDTYAYYNGTGNIATSTENGKTTRAANIEISASFEKPSCSPAVFCYGDSGSTTLTGNKDASGSGSGYCTKYNNARAYRHSSYSCGNLKEATYTQDQSSRIPSSYDFPGKATVRCTIGPSKAVKDVKYDAPAETSSNKMTSNSFGNYSYTIYTKNEELYPLKLVSSDEFYKSGSFNGSSSINRGQSSLFKIASSSFKYYSSSSYRAGPYKVVNATISLENEGGYVSQGSTKKSISSDGNSYKTIEISPNEFKFELQSDGKYHVKVKISNLQIKNGRFSNTDDKITTYAHPNILDTKSAAYPQTTEALASQENPIQNVQIFDGGGRIDKNSAKTYGNFKFNLSNYTWKPIQKLFYYLKNNTKTSEFTLENQVGDFFIHIWDQNNDVPPIKWLLNGAIRNDTYKNDDFGEIRSNYGFNGLHRMFIPYSVYTETKPSVFSQDKSYAAFSEAANSALVLAGFTIPANTMLVKNGLQTLSGSKIRSTVTPPNTALTNLTKQACKKLRELKTGKNSPDIYIIKYRMGKNSNIEGLAECAPSNNSSGTNIGTSYGIYQAETEEELKKVLSLLAQKIKSENLENDLSIELKDD